MLRVNEGNLSGQVDVLIGKAVQGWVDQINHADFYTQMINCCVCVGGGQHCRVEEQLYPQCNLVLTEKKVIWL